MTMNRGWIVTHTCDVVSADPGALRSALAAIRPGSETAVKEPPGAHASLRRAAKSGAPAGFRWVEIGEDGLSLIFGLVSETKNATLRDYQGSADGWIAVSADGHVAVDPGNSQTTANAINALVDKYQRARGVLGAPEMWGITLALVRPLGAISVKTGLLYIPPHADARDLLTAIRSAYATGANGVGILAMPVDSSEAANELSAPVSRSLTDLVEEILVWAEEREPKHERGEKIRPDGIKTRMESLVSIQEQAQRCVMGLEMKIELLRDAVGIAQGKLIALLSE